MGKVEEEQPLPISVIGEAERAEQNAGNNNRRGCCIFKKLVSFRCVFALLFGVAVLLSAIFWLPIFHHGDQKDLDLDSEYAGHAMVASFMVNKPASFLEDFSLRLQDDIFDEMSFHSTKVELLSLESSDGSNKTRVVFAVESDSTTRSLIRDTFVSILIHQSPFRLTASLFGDPFSFEVLKFLGGITVSPQQSGFLVQSVQLNFNFTLNFSIQQLQNDFFDELREQLKSGLRLTPYENLYISFTNLRGSTVAPPTIIQCQVLMAVGINPSKSRIKQLAQTIKDSHAKNLGLNNTVFGRVKQVRLSSVLQHSLGGIGAPSPAPMPHLHHHHHHLHHHHHESNFAPAISPSPRTENGRPIAGKGSAPHSLVPTPVPTQGMSHKAKPPGCHFRDKNRYPRNANQHSHLTPIFQPTLAPNIAPSPKQQTHPPMPPVHQVPASSPLPSVVFAHVKPPSERGFNAEPPDLPSSISPSPSSSSAVITLSNLGSLLLFLFLALYL